MELDTSDILKLVAAVALDGLEYGPSPSEIDAAQ
jgi:hypothetical protein